MLYFLLDKLILFIKKLFWQPFAFHLSSFKTIQSATGELNLVL